MLYADMNFVKEIYIRCLTISMIGLQRAKK